MTKDSGDPPGILRGSSGDLGVFDAFELAGVAFGAILFDVDPHADEKLETLACRLGSPEARERAQDALP